MKTANELRLKILELVKDYTDLKLKPYRAIISPSGKVLWVIEFNLYFWFFLDA